MTVVASQECDIESGDKGVERLIFTVWLILSEFVFKIQ